ncbi:MAG: SlyX family protein [Alphaproteobacteria bacterium]|nr:SlyX family protein [Alphaproteobacteria bacterium]
MQALIIQLQEMLAHQSEDISRLSDELHIQQKEIAKLTMKVMQLQTKLDAALQDPAHGPSGEKEPPPPHY